LGTTDAQGLSIRTAATQRIFVAAAGNVGIQAGNPSVPLAIGGDGVNVYGTSAWVQDNIHVRGNETLTQGGEGRLRVGTAWNYVGLYADVSSTGVQNDLVLGSSTGIVRIGPNGGGQNLRVSALEGGGNGIVMADNSGVLYKSTSGNSNAPVKIHSVTLATQSNANPVPVQTFNTGIAVANFDCVMVEHSTSYDIQENGRNRRKLWMHEIGGVWHVSVDFGAHSNNNPNLTNLDVKYICYAKNLVEWLGNPRTHNVNY
jgi:hypothetical protein